MFMKHIIFVAFAQQCSGFVTRLDIKITKKHRPILHSIEINNDSPSLIAKTLSQQFYKYGIPQPYDEFLKQLNEKHIESVSLISKNNEIQGFVSIDTLHQPHTYDLSLIHISEPTRPY